MPTLSSPADILSYAKANNWLALSTSEGNILNIFLTPAGNILEIYFEKNKVTLKELPYYVCK
jgi:hypothetical protein